MALIDGIVNVLGGIGMLVVGFGLSALFIAGLWLLVIVMNPVSLAMMLGLFKDDDEKRH